MSDDGLTVAVGAPYNDGAGSDAGHVRIFALAGAPTQLPIPAPTKAPTQLPVPIPTMSPTPRPTSSSQPTLLPTPTQKEKDENDDRVVLRVRKSINSSLFLHSSTSFFLITNKDKFNKHLFTHCTHFYLC